jgi:NADP-dependent 3-hydroxy acid dehydrogenase YdfG
MKKVVITGGGSGLGAEVARQLKKQGFELALVGKTESKLKKIAKEISSKFYVCDVANRQDVAHTVSQIVQDIGGIDYLVNAAGLWTEETLETKRPELREEVIRTNILGVIEFTKACLPYLEKSDQGRILNVISVAGTDESKDSVSGDWQTYQASKWAVTGFSKALKKSLENKKIQVIEFHPGGFESNLFETSGYDSQKGHNQSWMMKTIDVAEVLVFAITRPKDVYMEKVVFSKDYNA